MAAIKVKDIGPIEKLTIPLPEGGGVVVLRGGQGSGKSTAIAAASALAGGPTDGLSLRDGGRRGEVVCGSAKLTVGKKRIQGTGVLEVETIESRYDIGRLIEPGIKDPDRRDVSRLKTLLSLAGVVADTAAYRRLVDEIDADLWEDGDLDMITSDDPVDLHSRMTRAIQGEARKWEKKADRAMVDLEPLVTRARELADAPDLDTASEEVDRTTREALRLESQRDATENAAAAATEARAALADCVAAAGSTSLSDLKSRVATDKADIDLIQRDIAVLQERLTEKRQDVVVHQAELDAELSRQAEMKRLDLIVAKAPEPFDHSALDAANEARDDAIETRDRARFRMMVDRELEAAKRKNDETELIAKRAEQLRGLTRAFEAILVDQLPDIGLRFLDGRLVTQTDRSEAELYDDLSHGERGILAVGIAAAFLPANGVATVPQEVWSGISEANQKLIADAARAKKITILTAQVDDTELHVETM